ncbi:MAG: HlyD family efflux transporter periplasmic adaptor subunit [Verrucomicrobia bacterium]|jgi:HlyD family secretion protein|nr:HlyD family efflux transporter periplasmic adaptor subunit [Verrucomicrobiota bacterium]MBT7067468.1 HlyD family efflux transporter periplasmic adaptor subunit [Verrucomicrobiota bacterium]
MIKKSSRKVLTGLLLAALAVAAYRYWSGNGSTTYTFTTVQSIPRDITIDVSASGDLESEDAVNISAPDVKHAKKITYLIPEGSIVKVHDVLATFDSLQLEDQLENLLRAGLYAQLRDTEISRAIAIDDRKAELASRRENEKIARLTHESMQYAPELEQKKAQIQLNQAVANVSLAENRLKQEEQKWVIKLRQIHDLIEANEKRIEEVRASIDNMTIRAASKGLVVYPKTRVMGTTRKVQLGDSLYKGQRFIVIPNLFKMTAQVEVAEEEIRRVRLGQRASVYLEAFKDAEFTGEVYRIDRLAHVKENNAFIKVFTVSIRINEQDLERLRPGMNARVSIAADHYAQAISLPLKALYSDSAGDWVYIRGDDGPEKVAVKLVDANDEWAALAEPVEGAVILNDQSFKKWLRDPARSDADLRWEIAP